jgi:hypothetical protein
MKSYKKHLITLGAGLLIALSVAAALGVFKRSEAYLIMKDLSNGFLAASVIIGGVGLLSVVSAGGNFDILTYSLKKFVRILRFKPGKYEKGPGFYEYRSEKAATRKPLWFLVIVGAFYFGVSLFFVWLFYKYS